MSRDSSRDLSQPKPLSSPDCDLRGLEWMPTETSNMLESDLFLQSNGDEFKAAMALIWKSWRQVPAGSLPNDDKSLAILSGAQDWTSVRTMALHGWKLCADGRLYHPIVAAKAMEALPHRQQFIEKKTADSERKERERQARKVMFATLREAGFVPNYNTKTKDLREAIAQLEAGKTPQLVTTPSRDVSQDLSHDLSRLGQGHHTTVSKKKTTSSSMAEKGGTKRVPKNFQVTADMVLWAAEKAPLVHWERETEQFRDWEFKHARKDWAATWRTWLRNAQLKAEADQVLKRASPSGESAYERRQRELVEQATGGLASRRPRQETSDVAPIDAVETTAPRVR